jgi:hypothetical protein
LRQKLKKEVVKMVDKLTNLLRLFALGGGGGIRGITLKEIRIGLQRHGFPKELPQPLEKRLKNELESLAQKFRSPYSKGNERNEAIENAKDGVLKILKEWQAKKVNEREGDKNAVAK